MTTDEPGTDDCTGDSLEAAPTKAWQWAVLTLAIVLVILARSPDVLLLPSLEAEDGPFVFQHFYTVRDAGEILRFKSGYVPLVANLIAYCSVRLPTRAIPYGLAWVPLAITLAAYTALFGSGFRYWLGPDSTRALLCVLFALAPLAQWHLLAHTDYSIWNSLLLLVLLSVTPLSPVAWRRYASWGVANVLVWSHPLTMLVAPILALRLYREERIRAIGAVTLVNLVLHQALGTESTGVFAGLGWNESAAKIVDAVAVTTKVASGTAFRAAFGPVTSAWSEATGSVLPLAWALLVLVVAALACRRAKRLRVVFGLLAYFVFAITFLSVLVRDSLVAPQLNLAVRYVYLPSLAFVMLYVLVADSWVRAAARAEPVRRLALGTFLAWYAALNAQLGHYILWNGAATRPADGPWSPYVQAHEDNGRIVRDFFAELAAIEARTGSREGFTLVADKKNDWPIRLGPRPERRRPAVDPGSDR
jgi:hypothetical protein